MNPDEVGKNIVRAMSVVRAAQREVDAMLRTLDEILVACGWTSVSSTKWLALSMNGAQLGQPQNWCAGALERIYLRRGLPQHSEVVAYEVLLEPAGGSIPLLAGSRLSLAAPMTDPELYALWSRGGKRAIGAPTSQPGIVEYEAKQLNSAFSLVGTATVHAVPLCEIDRTNIEAKIVRPVLDHTPSP